MLLAPAKMVSPKNTELIPVKIWISSTKLIRMEQITAKTAIEIIKEYIVNGFM